VFPALFCFAFTKKLRKTIQMLCQNLPHAKGGNVHRKKRICGLDCAAFPSVTPVRFCFSKKKSFDTEKTQ